MLLYTYPIVGSWKHGLCCLYYLVSLSLVPFCAIGTDIWNLMLWATSPQPFHLDFYSSVILYGVQISFKWLCHVMEFITLLVTKFYLFHKDLSITTKNVLYFTVDATEVVCFILFDEVVANWAKFFGTNGPFSFFLRGLWRARPFLFCLIQNLLPLFSGISICPSGVLCFFTQISMLWSVSLKDLCSRWLLQMGKGFSFGRLVFVTYMTRLFSSSPKSQQLPFFFFFLRAALWRRRCSSYARTASQRAPG